MTFKYLYEKYKNLNSEEDFVNDYSYKTPSNLKSNKSTKFKRPKLYYINKYVENFESFKSGSKKTLQEFQNLYIHKFLVTNLKKQKQINKSLDILGLKEKLKLRYNINNRNEENYKVKEEAFSSLMKIIKNNNDNNKQDVPKRQPSRTFSRINILYNNKNSSKSSRKSIFKLSQRNKYLTYQYLKQGQKFLTKSVQKSEKQTIKKFQEKSHLALLEEISARILKDKLNKKTELNKRCYSSYKIRNTFKMKTPVKLEENKSCFNIVKKSIFINKNNLKYYEMSKKGCNLSDAFIIEKREYPNKIQKILKKHKRPFSNYDTNKMKRPMSALERYYIKFGASI